MAGAILIGGYLMVMDILLIIIPTRIGAVVITEAVIMPGTIRACMKASPLPAELIMDRVTAWEVM